MQRHGTAALEASQREAAAASQPEVPLPYNCKPATRAVGGRNAYPRRWTTIEESMSELIETGLKVTLIGMSTVFVLLGVLVWLVQLMSRFDRQADDAASGEPRADDAELIGVIGAAVRMFRAGRAGTHGSR
jgi:Na+-transporting methylmalonyl-CoA/oxaloacetate decarboxylase gamma subunit